MAIKLKTSSGQFDSLHADLDKVRRTSTTVKVDKQALENLLADHAALHDAVGKLVEIKVEEPDTAPLIAVFVHATPQEVEEKYPASAEAA